MQQPQPHPCRIRLDAADKHKKRKLTIHFGQLVEHLLDHPQPQPADLKRLQAGADLMNAIIEESTDFGAAAPGVENEQEEDLARAILAISDDAFHAAHDILAMAPEPFSFYPRDNNSEIAALGALFAALDCSYLARVSEHLTNVPPAIDHSVSEEFL